MPCSVIEDVEVVGIHLSHAAILVVLHAGKGSGVSVLLPTVAVVRHATFQCFIDFAEISESDEGIDRFCGFVPSAEDRSGVGYITVPVEPDSSDLAVRLSDSDCC